MLALGSFCFFLPYLYPTAKYGFSHAALAQLVERLIRNQQIISSNLIGGSIISRVYVSQKHINPYSFYTLRRIFVRFAYGDRTFLALLFYPDAEASWIE